MLQFPALLERSVDAAPSRQRADEGFSEGVEVVGRGRHGTGFAAGEAAKGLALAFEFVGAVFLFWFLGRLLDNWLGIQPWAQVVGALVGWVGGFLHVYYATRDVGGAAG